MVADTGYAVGTLFTTKLVNGRWTRPVVASFAESAEYDGDVPFFAPDGERLYFISRQPLHPGGEVGRERIWYVERAGDGWSRPEAAGDAINSLHIHWQFAVTANGNIYFGARSGPGARGMGDIYVSRLVEGRYQAAENLGDAINTQFSEGSPYVSPDETYLLFSRMGGPDQHSVLDLFVSYRAGDGWTEPKNLGERINAGWANCPVVSPDGKYLFFISQRSGNSDIFWVDARVIDRLR